MKHGPKVLHIIPINRYPALMDAAISQRIAELRREIEDLNEQARIYRSRRTQGWQDQIANDIRIARLEAIMRELVTLRTK